MAYISQITLPSQSTYDLKDKNALTIEQRGAANGVASLDSSGIIPSSQLPSYVDDVLEYSSLSNFPETGEEGKIYVAKDTNKTYRWSGSTYVIIGTDLALGETSSTAYRGDRGATAYNHANAKGSAFSSGLYKITTNSEGHVTAATAVQKSDITALGVSGLTNLVDGSQAGSVMGINSIAESDRYTIGKSAFAEGYSTKASGNFSHAEGIGATASGYASHAEGGNTTASGSYSHAEGSGTTASGGVSHAEGYSTTASGAYSHAQNLSTIAQRKSQTVLGQFNIADTQGTTTTRGQYAIILGNGASGANRSNAATIDWSGNQWLAGKLTVGADATAAMDVVTLQQLQNETGEKVNYNSTELDDPVIGLNQNGRVVITDSQITDPSGSEPAIDSAAEVISFTSNDTVDSAATDWTGVSTLESGETHSSLFNKISKMFKNIRFIKNKINSNIYQSGDSEIIPYNTSVYGVLTLPGVVTSGSSAIFYTLYTPKSMQNINSVTVTKFKGGIRAFSGGYLNGSGDTYEWTEDSNLLGIYTKIINNYTISVCLKFSSPVTFAGATIANNTPANMILTQLQLDFT